MGLVENDNDGGYILFNNGDNAIVKPDEIEPEAPDKDSQYDEDYQLKMLFDAVAERDHSEQGMLPGWFNSKLTISDSEDHTSDLAKLLQAADVLEDVINQLVGGNEAAVEKVVSGDSRFVAENSDENIELMKAVSNHISGEVFRVGTKHNKSGEYSKVDDIYGAAEDPFTETEDSDAEEDSGSGEKDVLFGEDDENPETVEEEL